MGLAALREKKMYTDKTKLNPVACDNTVREGIEEAFGSIDVVVKQASF